MIYLNDQTVFWWIWKPDLKIPRPQPVQSHSAKHTVLEIHKQWTYTVNARSLGDGFVSEMFAVQARDLSLDPQHPCKEPYMVAQPYNPSVENMQKDLGLGDQLIFYIGKPQVSWETPSQKAL